VDNIGDTQELRTNVNGELLVSMSTGDLATEATLDAINDKLSNDFGADALGIRVNAQIGNDSGAADFNAGADGVQTLRVSANLKRNGNELSYDAGASDANTLRVVMASGGGLATEAKQDAEAILLGALVETAPATDTASSGLNGRLQRIAQRLTSLLAVLPASLGAKLSAASFSIVPASDAIFNVSTTGAAPSAVRKKLIFKPSKNNTGSIYFGPAGVTIATGVEIIGPDRIEFEMDAGDYYLISDTAAQVVEILEKV
jgi:hypothetical protein